ncbi:MAG: methionyl-tRNA formyltransferase [Ignavibacteria bacterium]|nr:methionyl-tRNA formyltransferase [Ignavibacteria bacterium]
MSQGNARIMFMGTPEFAVPALRKLHEKYGIIGVVTAPDKPMGRGLVVHPSAVSMAAEELGISTVLKPASLKSETFVQEVRKLNPDIICVIAFRILPEAVYSMAHLGAFNVHASLLPKYRGAAPINHAIINGEHETGVTSFLLNTMVDAGVILLQHRVNITTETTAGDLYDVLKLKAAECAVETCALLINGSAAPMHQNEARTSPAPKVFRETSTINWAQQPSAIRNFIHGLSPMPCAWTLWEGRTLKIFRASTVDEHATLGGPVADTIATNDVSSGFFRIVGNHFLVRCSDGWLSLDEIQLPAKRRMKTAEFLSGYRGPTEGRFE